MVKKTLSVGLRHVFLVSVGMFILVPFVWIILVGFKTTQEAIAYPPTFLPLKPTLANYIYVLLHYDEVKRFYWNSIVIAAVVVPIVTLITSLAGYSFARLRFPGRDRIFWFLVASMFFPSGISGLFIIFEITHKLGLLDTRLGLILPYLTTGCVTYTFIMRGTFLDIPRELEDAARIDGCSRLQIFFRIMVPIASSAVAVILVLCFITVWGEYLLALTLTTTVRARTLPVGLSHLSQHTAGETSLNMLAAAYTLAILPPIVLFLLAQRTFMKGLAAGAFKY